MEIREKLQKASIQRQSDKDLLKSRLLRKSELIDELENVLKSQTLAQEVAKEVQSKLSSRIDNIVNLGLATCFPEYHFNLLYVPARGKTEVEFHFTDSKGFEVEPEEQNGGGVLDLVCFCLRVAVYSISETDNVIVFDEPFRFVSKNLRSKVADLLHTLSEELKLQFIEVTHIDELADNSDLKITVTKVGDVSHVS